MKSDSQRQIIVDVFFLSGDRETMFSARYTLGPDEADESKEFTGEPEYVSVIVNESEAVVEDFTGEPCSGTRTTPTGIAYDANGELHIGFAC